MDSTVCVTVLAHHAGGIEVRTKLLACAAATAAAFAGTAGAADARANHKNLKPESFNGSCEFSGSVTFTPPMTMTPQPIAQHADAPGTCTGTFTDRFGRPHTLDG